MSLEVNIEKKLDGFTLRAAFTAGNTSTALLGASGCGKSMTLRCIAGIVKPDRGRIVLDGRVLFDSDRHIDLPPQQRGVGLLFQNYALFPNMTVEQNVLCGLKAEKDPATRRAACADSCDQLFCRCRDCPQNLLSGFLCDFCRFDRRISKYLPFANDSCSLFGSS